MLVFAFVALVVPFTHAQSPLECAGRCNLALCLDSSDSISSADYQIMARIVDRINDLTLSVNKRYTIGFAIYASVVADERTCFMTRDSDELRKCTASAFRPEIRDRESTHLELCFDRINRHPNFWKNAHDTCDYRVIVITDGNTSDMKKSADNAKLLQSKGVKIDCYTLGFEDDYDDRHEYDRICDKHVMIETMQMIHNRVDNIVKDLECEPLAPTEPPHICDNCKMVNGVGFKRDPDRCDCWIKCIFDAKNNPQVIKQCCGCGLFWNNDILTCMPAGSVSCDVDSCLGNVDTYAHENNCRSYWTCSKRRTVSTQCCSSSEKYDSVSRGCVPDPSRSCTAECICTVQTTPTRPEQECIFVTDPNDSSYFFVKEHTGRAPTRMKCPGGTVFDQNKCECIRDTKTKPSDDCKKILDIRCTEFPVIDHAEDTSITNEAVDVDIQNGQCSFNGSARLLVPRFSNMDWGKTVGVCVEFFGDANVRDHNVALISNTDCEELASIEIRLMRSAVNAPVVNVIVRTYKKVVSLNLRYQEFASNKVYVSYENSKVIFSIRHNDGTILRVEESARENIIRCRCSLQVGYGWDQRYFTGRIFDVCVYKDCLPPDFHPTRDN